MFCMEENAGVGANRELIIEFEIERMLLSDVVLYGKFQILENMKTFETTMNGEGRMTIETLKLLRDESRLQIAFTLS